VSAFVLVNADGVIDPVKTFLLPCLITVQELGYSCGRRVYGSHHFELQGHRPQKGAP